jgi:tRNA dimethylallyltransferase
VPVAMAETSLVSVHRLLDSPIVAIVGATATGKSDLSLSLAAALDGEVINADSMQLYQGMNVGTAKLPPALRQGVIHHLLDVWPVTRVANIADYQRAARHTIASIRKRGKVPILVGGSGLYIRAALDDMELKPTDPTVRQRWESELIAVGAEALHTRLAQVDKAAAAVILPGNGRRIVRALEVIEVTGQPYTAVLPEYRYAPLYEGIEIIQFGVTVTRPQLDARIAARVEQMWAQDFVGEVRELIRGGLREGVTARRALGYAQVLAFLAGEGTESNAKDLTIRSTRRFARRQESWFRRDPRIYWIDGATAVTASTALQLLHRI